MPDDLPDGLRLPSVAELPDIDGIHEFLGTKYSRSNMAESFVDKIKAKQEFIELGLNLDDGQSCPFCEQEYSPQASELINKYNAYLEDEEAKVTRWCQDRIDELKTLKRSCEKCIADVLRSAQDFDKKTLYIPSMQDWKFTDPPAVEGIATAIKSISQCLKDKSSHIDRTDFDISDPILEIKNFITRLDEVLEENSNIMGTFNPKKNNVQVEKRELDR